MQRTTDGAVSRSVHTYHPYVQTGWNEYYIGFEGAMIDDMVKGGFLSKENQVLEVGVE